MTEKFHRLARRRSTRMDEGEAELTVATETVHVSVKPPVEVSVVSTKV